MEQSVSMAGDDVFGRFSVSLLKIDNKWFWQGVCEGKVDERTDEYANRRTGARANLTVNVVNLPLTSVTSHRRESYNRR